jgi:hypothetical protein
MNVLLLKAAAGFNNPILWTIFSHVNYRYFYARVKNDLESIHQSALVRKAYFSNNVNAYDAMQRIAHTTVIWLTALSCKFCCESGWVDPSNTLAGHILSLEIDLERRKRYSELKMSERVAIQLLNAVKPEVKIVPSPGKVSSRPTSNTRMAAGYVRSNCLGLRYWTRRIPFRSSRINGSFEA